MEINDKVEILKAIDEYAKAYGKLNCLQERHKKNVEEKKQEKIWLPIGDQKAGVIGEFYALIYATNNYESEGSEVTIEKNHSNKGSDIKIGSDVRIQVKTVSEFAGKRKFSIITDIEVDYVYFIRLNCDFRLNGFWIIDKDNLSESSLTAPMFGKEEQTGSEIFRDKSKCQNVFLEFDKFLKEHVYS